MKDWKEIAKKLFPKEFEEFGGISGRNPKVKFSTIEVDVLRRDLSINALFYDLEKKEIIDLVGGLIDIENKIIRMVGDPGKRIEEDPLRILRAIRFSYRYGFDIDKDTFDSIKKLGGSLSRITKERIWEEIKKSFSYKGDFKKYLDTVTDLSLWDHIFPELVVNKDIKSCKYLSCYIANLLKDNNIDKLERKMILTFKIESDVSSKSCHLIRILDLSPENAFLLYKDRVKCHVTDDMILDWINVNDLKSNIYKVFVNYKPTVSSEDLMELGFKGKELGDEIKRLESEKFKSMLS